MCAPDRIDMPIASTSLLQCGIDHHFRRVCRSPVEIRLTIPASLNEVAITFVPLSCPSNPTFATKTRIGLSQYTVSIIYTIVLVNVMKLAVLY